jgi:hypothetical protein
MSSLQELSVKQINEALAAASERHVPVTITTRTDNHWLNLQSHALAVRAGNLLAEMPPSEADLPPFEFVPGIGLGLSFKLKHHKHIFTATLSGHADYALDEGGAIKVLAFCLPTRMQRLQRRVYYRADVPPNRIVRASFWLGGREAEPRGTSATLPVWSGKVTNLSAGGFQLVATLEAAGLLEVGDSVGVRLAFGAAGEAVYADAQFRHALVEGDHSVMGFQFVGLGQTNEGKEALRLVSQRVSQFQQAAQAAQASQQHRI